MNINVNCPGCGKSSEVDQKLIGSRMKCPDCAKEFEIKNPNLVPCPDCFELVSKHAAVCPRCGAPLGNSDGTYPDSKEDVILNCHPGLKNYMGLSILGFLSFAICFVGLLWLAFSGKDLSRIQVLLILGFLFLAFLFGVVLMLQVWFKTHFIRYLITNRRIVVTRGLIAKDQNEIWIKDIRGATLIQSAWQRILGIGDISIGTAATAEAEIRMVGIKQPQAVVNKINQLRH